MHTRIIPVFLVLITLNIQSQDLDSIFNSKKEIVKSIKNDKRKAEFLYECANFFYPKDVRKSEFLYQQSLNLVKNKNNLLEGNILWKLGFINRNKGNLSTSLRYFNNAKNIYKQIDDLEQVATVNIDIGSVYRYKNEISNEIKFYKKGLSLAKEVSEEIVGKAFLHLGAYYGRLQKLDSSIYCYNEALEVFKKINNDKRVYHVYNNLPNTYFLQGNYQKVLDIRTLVLDYAKRGRRQLLLTSNYHNIASAYKQLKEYDKASKYLDSAIIVAKEENFKLRLSKSYQSLSDLSFLKKDYKDAYLYHQQYKIYSDSIFKLQQLNAIEEVELENIYKLKDKNLEILTKERAFEKKMYLVIIFAFVLLGTPIIILMHRNSLNKSKIIKANFEKNKIKRDSLIQKNTNSENEIKNLVADNSMRIEFLKQLLTQLKNKRFATDSKELQEYIKDLSFKVKQQLTTESKLTLLKERIGTVNSGFDNMLMNSYQELSKTEREVCALLRLNMSIKEIASIRNSSTNAIKAVRYRIRKKMNVPKEQKLENFIQKINSS